MRMMASSETRGGDRAIRRRLVLGTALAGSVVALAPAAIAQTAPTTRAAAGELPNGLNVRNNPNAAIVRGGTATSQPTRLTVDLAAKQSVIEWTHFDIPTDSQATFRDTSGVAGKASVLNRVVGFEGLGPTASAIMGKLNAGTGTDVWLINPAGILVGAGGAINTGGFVASTLDIANGDFYNGGQFRLSGTSTAAVTVAGGSIRSNGGALLLVAPRIKVDGTLNAAQQGGPAGDVALVAASDARFSLATGSPLSVFIAEGTDVTTPMIVEGAINGRNVYFAVATRSGVTDTLLRVDAAVTATTAFADDKGIVFAAGAAAPGVRLSTLPGDDVGGAVGIVAGGSYRTLGTADDPDITLRATRAINASANLTSAGAIDIGSATAAASSTGTMRATDDIRLTAAGPITTGDVQAASFRATAPGQIRLGDIRATGDIVVAGGAIVADSATATAGRLAMTAATGNLVLGAGDAGTTTTLTADNGTLSLGTIGSGTGKLTVRGARLAGGTFDSDAAIDIQTSGAAAATAATSRTGAVLVRGSSVRIGAATAATALTLTATAGDVILSGTGTAGGTARVDASGNARLAALTSTASDVIVDAGGALSGAAAAAPRLSAASAAGDVVVTTGGSARADSIVAGRSITVAAGSIDLGSVRAGTTLGLTAAGSLRLATGESGAAATLQAGGAVTLPGSLDVGGNLTITGRSVALGVDAGNERILADGRILVTSTAGSITGGTGLTLASDADGAGGEPLILDATGGGIAFDADSDLGSAGSAIGVRLATAGTNLTLGRVTASALRGANAAHGLLPTLTTQGAIRLAGPTSLANGLAIDSTGGPVSLGDVTISNPGQGISVSTLGGGGTISAGTLNAPGMIGLTAGGAVSAGTIDSATGAVAISGTRLTLGRVDAATTLDLDATAGTLALGTGTAGGDAALDAAGAVRLGSLATTAGDIAIIAVDGVTGTDPAGRAQLSAGGPGSDIRVAGGRLAQLGTVVARDAVTIGATRIDAIDVTATGGALTASGGTVTIGNAVAGTTLGLVATGGAVTLTSGLSGGDATLDASGAVRVDTLATIAGDIRIDAGQGVGGTMAGSRARLTAGGAASDIAVTGGGAALLGTVGAGGGVTLAATQIDATDVTATNGALTATGGGVAIGSARAGTTLAVTATTGDLSLTNGTSGGAATLTATRGAVALTTLTTANGTIMIDAANGLTATTLSAGGAASDIDVVGGTAALIGTASAGDRIDVAATRVAIGSATAGGALDIGGGTIDVATATAGTSLTIDATGDLMLGAASSGSGARLSAGGIVTVPGALTVGGDLVIRGAMVQLGVDAGPETQAANGAIDITATRDGIVGGAGLTVRANADGIGTEALILDATGGDIAFAADSLLAGGTAGQSDIGIRLGAAGRDLTLGTVVARGLLGAAADHAAPLSATLATAGDIRITGPVSVATALSLITTSGGIDLAGVDVTGAGQGLALSATGGIAADRLDAVGAVAVDAGLAAQIGTIRSSAADVTVSGRSVAIDTARAATALALTSDNGTLRLGSGTAGTSATLTALGGGITLGSLTTTAGGVTIATDAGIDAATIAAGGPGSALSISGTGTARLGSVSAADDVTVTIGGIDATTIDAGGDLALTARTGDVRVGTADAGGAALLRANGDVVAGAATGAGTGLTATGSATIEAGGTAILDAVTVGGAGSTLTIEAADAVITDVQSASTITIMHNDRGTGSFLLGSLATAAADPSNGFDLADAELDFLHADALTIRTDRGGIRFGALTLSADSGGTSASFLASRSIEVRGRVEAAGTVTPRTMLFGAVDGTRTGLLQIVATADGNGGSLLLANADATLRAERIEAGQQAGFLDEVAAIYDGSLGDRDNALNLNVLLISNPRSTLYNATGTRTSGSGTGTAYADGVKLLTAGNLAIDFGAYALFQNTGSVGAYSGVDIGSTAGTFTLTGSDAAFGGSVFSLFGTLNGIGDIQTALLGNPPLAVSLTDPSATRINGCLIGGGGCIVTVISQPILNVFDASRVDILKTPDKLQLPFDPLVGTNNETLFTGVGAMDTAVEEGECAVRDRNGTCAPAEGEQ